MKHHIVINSKGIVLENMMSNISSPKELRLRLSKKWPGKHRIYFKTHDANYGIFYVDGVTYFWFIDPEDEHFRKRKPTPIPEMHLFRKSTLDYNYRLYENDIVSLPNLNEIRVRKVQFPNHNTYFLMCILNGQPSWVNLSDLCSVLSADTPINALKNAAGKTIRITQAIQCSISARVLRRGIITGRPISWELMPTKVHSRSYKYIFL